MEHYLNLLLYTAISLKYNSDKSVLELEVISQNCDGDFSGI